MRYLLPFTPGRAALRIRLKLDSSDSFCSSWAAADGFRIIIFQIPKQQCFLPKKCLRIDKRQLLSLTTPEVQLFLTWWTYVDQISKFWWFQVNGVFTTNPGALTPMISFVEILLDMRTTDVHFEWFSGLIFKVAIGWTGAVKSDWTHRVDIDLIVRFQTLSWERIARFTLLLILNASSLFRTSFQLDKWWHFGIVFDRK